MKSTNMLTFLLASILIILGLSLMSVIVPQKPWDIPAKFKTMKNPKNNDASSVAAGKDLWNKNCASCHGKTGLGDGPKARTLETYPVNFTKAEFQGQTDGDLFYKTKFGRGEMPKYEGKIGDDDIWLMVNFMRSLKK
jgi:mono/diheme cytochrome c family protein